jgi:hypothetical protein
MNQLNVDQVRQHATILGWLHIAINALTLVLGCFLFALLLGIGLITNDQVAFSVLGVTGTAVGTLLVLLALPGIVAGYGLLRRRDWGRILALVVGFLGLFNFPLGTAIGIYTFWVLLQESATDCFAA